MARYLQQLNDRMARRGRRFVAVDFDSRRLRVVSAKRTGAKADILKCHSVEVPADIAVGDAAMFGAFLRKALRKLHLGGKPVLMSVPRSQAVIKPLSLPAGTPQAEVAAMVHFQVDKELPFRVEDAVVDHIPGGGHYGAADGATSGEGVNVLVAAVRLPTVDYYRRLAEAGQFRLLKLGLRPSTTACCVRACDEAAENKSVAMVHVGFDEIEISVLHGGSLSFTRSVSVRNTPPNGGPPRPVETLPPIPLVPANGSSPSANANGHAPPAVAAGVPPAASPLPPPPSPGPSVAMAMLEIVRTLQSYQALQRQGQIAMVLVAGDTGIEADLVNELTSRLKMSCRRLSTDKLVRKGTPPDDAMAAALGLALGHSADKIEFDFLAPRRPPVHRDAKQTKMVAAVIAVLLVVGGLLAANYVYLEGKDEQLRKKQDELKKLQKTDEELKKLAAQAAAVDGWARGRQNWLAHWAYLSDLLPDAKSVYLQNLTVSPATNVQTKIKGRPDEPVATLSFTLRARDREIITDITKDLMQEASRPTPSYVLTPSGIDPCNDEHGYPQQMRFSLTVPQDMIKLLPPPMSDLPYVYRPEDDGSAEMFGRKPSAIRVNAPPPPAPSGSGGNSAAAASASSFREVSFDEVKRGAELLAEMSATPLTLIGRLVAEPNPRAFAPSASAETHLAFRLEENQPRQRGGGGRGGRGGEGGTGRFVYVYIPKNSAMAQEIQRRGERELQRVRVEGRAHFTGDYPEVCPVGLLAERIR